MQNKKIHLKLIFVAIILQLSNKQISIQGHAILDEPPGRSSLWHFPEFKNATRNDNDSGLNCGDFSAQWNLNGGKCGICGDQYDAERENELPNGKYAKNAPISRRYPSGSTVKSRVHVVANHYGFFEFRVCSIPDRTREATQECLNKRTLDVVGSPDKKWWIPLSSDVQAYFTIPIKLPDNFKCDHCVFQWDWTTLEYSGDCGNGTFALGCGPQRTFRACADITVY